MQKSKPSIRETVNNNMNPKVFVNNHLLSESKSVIYKYSIGIIIVIIGVGITKLPVHSSIIASFSCDAIGYGIHGIGCIPFIHSLTNIKKKK